MCLKNDIFYAFWGDIQHIVYAFRIQIFYHKMARFRMKKQERLPFRVFFAKSCAAVKSRKRAERSFCSFPPSI